MLNPDTTLISLDNVGYHDGGKWLVRGVSFQITKGEIVTLIGPNGSGKSTTSKLALGIKQPTEGKVQIAPGTRVAYVPQKLQFDWTLPLTVRRFMTLTQPLQKADIVEALALTNTHSLLDSNVADLSGGELQRVLMARALATKPDFLALDEPVQGVDFNGEIALYDLIKSIRDQNHCGILLVSHDLHFVMAATDQVICLNGHVCCQGTPQAVTENSEYLKLFGDKAAKSLAIYHHHHDHTHLPDGTVRHADGTITDHCHPDDGHHHPAASKKVGHVE